MGFHKHEADIGVGFCDNCWSRIFTDEPIISIDKKLICEVCIEEMDEDGCSN